MSRNVEVEVTVFRQKCPLTTGNMKLVFRK